VFMGPLGFLVGIFAAAASQYLIFDPLQYSHYEKPALSN
jgi:hypothetical protein